MPVRREQCVCNARINGKAQRNASRLLRSVARKKIPSLFVTVFLKPLVSEASFSLWIG